MSRLINILLLLLLTSFTASAQWTLRPSFNDVKAWHEYGGGVFCRCAHGAFTIDGDGEVNTLTRTAGLSSASLTASAADADGKFWTLGYGDGSIDVCKGGRIFNFLPAIQVDGGVVDMTCDGDIILAAVGDVVEFFDVNKTELFAYCDFGKRVARVGLSGGVAYAVVGGECLSIDINAPNLQDAETWRKSAFDFPQQSNYDGATPRGMPEDNFNALAAADGKLLAVNQYCTQITRQGIEITKNPDNQKFTAAFYNPYNSAQYFLGGEDGTLYEYVDGNLRASYNQLSGAPIVSMDCNSAGDLFILSASENKPVSVFDHNGNWHTATSFLSMKSSSPKQLLFINDNIVLVNAGAKGIFAVDLGGTPLDFSDDKTAVCQVISGGVRVGTEINAMRLSQSGYLYVATDKGVAYTLTPESLVEGGVGFIRPISTETNDRDGSYSQYLLASKIVTSIAEDAAGRKWFGTKGAGVFVVNDDCNEEIMRFNTRNSPLPSDTIVALEIVQNTGEVFIHTANGLASYVSDAQKSADDLDNIIIYPNPVRPDYDGEIHISGLESGSDVRITDVAGHLVHKAVAESGLLSWDGNNLNGRRCATGVYLVFVYNVETGDRKVKKLLIVR